MAPPPSLSTLERGNPPPRRKSCAACIKAKRRCDLRQPSCLRCTQRRIECCYPASSSSSSLSSSSHVDSSRSSVKRQQESQVSSSSSSSSSSTSSFSSQLGISSPNNAAQSQELMNNIDILPELDSWETNPNFDFNLDPVPSFGGGPSCDSCHSLPVVTFNNEPTFQGELSFLDGVMAHSPDKAVTGPNIPQTQGPSLSGFDDPMAMVLRPPQSSSSSITSSRIQLLSLISELIEKRLGYGVDAMKGSPESMVRTGGTFWIHPAVFREFMPPCLEDALSACALHRAKNPANATMIQRVIERRYQKLLDAPVPTSSVPELLARTHALILYQIMLFFDDSWMARTLAIETASTLSDSAMALLEFVRHLPVEEDGGGNYNNNTNTNNTNGGGFNHPSRDIPLYPPTTARALYHDWTFQESMRRTLLASFMFIQLQRVLQTDVHVIHPFPTTTTTADSSSSSSSSYSSSSSSSFSSSCPPSSSSSSSSIALVQKALHQSPSLDGDGCDPRMVSCRSITLSAHLWNARDPLEFAVAWREKRHFAVRPLQILSTMKRVEPDDIDQLSRVLISTCMGIETAKAWFLAKGSTL